MGKFIDLTGRRFSRLVVIERAENTKGGQARWLCRCDCGKGSTVRGTLLLSGHTVSCGCYHRETFTNTKHGKRKSRIYRIWGAIKTRCYNPKATNFKAYGGRGVKICDEWRNDFKTFYEWAMAHGYTDDLTIDRIDVNGNYEPSNCRWATRKEQDQNKRGVKSLTFQCKTHTLREWADITGIHPSAIKERLKRGWSIEKALTTPSKAQKSGTS